MVEHGSPSEIASALTVSVNAVKSQLASIYRKLGVTSCMDAIETASRLDLFDKPDGPR